MIKRIALLKKGNMFGAVSQRGVAVASADPRREYDDQGRRACPSEERANAEVTNAVKVCVERGWSVFYDGPPLIDGAAFGHWTW